MNVAPSVEVMLGCTYMHTYVSLQYIQIQDMGGSILRAVIKGLSAKFSALQNA